VREQFVDAARRRFVGAPRWIFGTLVAANAVVTIAAFTAPGGYVVAAVVAAAGWLSLGLAFVVRLGLTVAVGGGLRSVWREWARWVSIPAVVAVTGGLVLLGVPVRAGLQLAKPAIVDFAEHADAQAPSRVGPYRVDRAERLTGGSARFLLKDTGFLDPAGFAYSPDGPPQRIGEDRYEHLGGAWYVWTESW
jgi:hypothetical protein